MPPHGHRRLKLCLLISAELQRCDQRRAVSRYRRVAPGSSFWMPRTHIPALFGQCLLCQASRLSMLTKRVAKGGRRVATWCAMTPIGRSSPLSSVRRRQCSGVTDGAMRSTLRCQIRNLRARLQNDVRV
jgi:hypothetical protein